jgi:TCP family transcription factor
MWLGMLVGFLVLALGTAGAFAIPLKSLVAWIALIVTILLAIIGLLLLYSLLRWLIRISLGAAISPAGEPPGKLIAIAFAAVMVPTIPLFMWNVGTRVLQNLFGGNPGYQSLSQLAQTTCSTKDESCILRSIGNSLAALVRFFKNILDDLSFARLPIIDLFWFVVAAVFAAFLVNLVRGAIYRSSGQMPLDVVRNLVPDGLRRRLPVAILLIAAFYLALSAMFAIPVLRTGPDLGLTSAAITDDLLRPPTATVERLKQLTKDLEKGPAVAEPPKQGELSTSNPDNSRLTPAQQAEALSRRVTTGAYVGIYDRQREYLGSLVDGAEGRFRQLAQETRSRASSSPRSFLGKRDKDRFVATVTEYYQTTVSSYEIRLYNCRNSLIGLRERIAQYSAGRDESSTSPFLRLFNVPSSGSSNIDKAASEVVQACPSANSPEQIEPKLPPDPFELLGPFGATVRWLVTTDSRAIATIIGMIGFGLLGATLSRMIRKSESQEGQLAGLESFFVVAGGVTAALVVYLGSYAVLGEQGSESNPYVVFVTCLVGAVFSEDIWIWARSKFMPKDEAKEQQAKEQQAKEQQAKEQQAKEQEAKEQEAKEQQAKEKQAKEQQAKEQEAKEQEADAGVKVSVIPPTQDQQKTLVLPTLENSGSVVPKTEPAVSGTVEGAPAADALGKDWSRYAPENSKN